MQADRGIGPSPDLVRTGGSTGGLDIVGLIISRRFGIAVGQVFMVFNAVIITLGALFNQKPELAMYTLIMLFVSARVIDAVQARAPRRFVLVVTQKHEQVAERIFEDLRRGVTYLQGAGAYTSTELRVLMCVMMRYELVDLRRIVNEIDPGAFTVVLEASDVIGRFDKASALQRLLG